MVDDNKQYKSNPIETIIIAQTKNSRSWIHIIDVLNDCK